LQRQKIIIDSFVYLGLQENQGSLASKNNGITSADEHTQTYENGQAALEINYGFDISIPSPSNINPSNSPVRSERTSFKRRASLEKTLLGLRANLDLQQDIVYFTSTKTVTPSLGAAKQLGDPWKQEVSKIARELYTLAIGEEVWCTHPVLDKIKAFCKLKTLVLLKGSRSPAEVVAAKEEAVVKMLYLKWKSRGMKDADLPRIEFLTREEMEMLDERGM
jgi:hypothetical protein